MDQERTDATDALKREEKCYQPNSKKVANVELYRVIKKDCLSWQYN
jgi:hypothetical protein